MECDPTRTSNRTIKDYTVVDPQLFWEPSEIYLHHLAKLGPTLFLFSGLITAIVQGDRADVRSNLRERVWEYRSVFAPRSRQARQT